MPTIRTNHESSDMRLLPTAVIVTPARSVFHPYTV